MKKIKVFVIVLITFLIVGGTLFFSKEENQKNLVTYIHSFDKTQKEFQIVSTYEKEGIEYLNGRYLEWDGEKLTLLDPSEKILWTKTFLFEDPKIVLNENRIGVYNEEGILYLYNGNGETLLEDNLENKIFNLKLSDQGLITHIKLEDKEEVLNYDFSSASWDRVTFIDSIPLDYWLNSSNNLMYTQVDFKDGYLYSHLYEKGKENTSLKAEVKDSIILKALPYKGGYIILTDSGIVKTSSDDINLQRDFDLVKDIILDGDEIYILYGDNLEVLNMDLESLHKKTYVLSYTSFHKHERYILLYGDKNIIALFNKEDKAQYASGTSIKKLTSQFNDLIVTLNSGVYTMRIRDVKLDRMEE